MGEAKLPTYFIKNARARWFRRQEIVHYDQHLHQEVMRATGCRGPAIIGITAGASCPNNLIEDTIRRLFELRGISRQELEKAA